MKASPGKIKKKTAISLFFLIIIFSAFFLMRNHEVMSLGALFLSGETISIEVYFCPGCREDFLEVINSSGHVACAFYSLTDHDLIRILSSKNATVKLFEQNFYPQAHSYRGFHPVRSLALMHNKFCILDRKAVVTGSLNPTLNGFSEHNDFIVIRSQRIAKIFERELAELGTFSYKKEILRRFSFDEGYIEARFCPEESCEDTLVALINSAEERILFAQFLITSQPVSDALVKASESVFVQGVIEQSKQNILGSKYAYLSSYIRVELKRKIHLKYWVIDDTVLTGSYNPSIGGNTKNDENIIIIKNRQIADFYAKRLSEIIVIG
ncbi:MAG TPA: hypothetical protein ENN46_00150 [Candidatus Woesearchaeota archaeon]|nr:hypothetical protein [Candidatus Woesearchaeota archaeon]